MGIIIKPVITEKTTALTEKTAERYVFRVSPDANKVEIKKAIVTLEKGQTIDFYANI